MITGSSQFLPNSSAISYAFGRRQYLAGHRDMCTGFCAMALSTVFINNEPPVVVGPWTEPLLVKFSAGTRVCGVRLRPGCASAVLGVPAVQLLNRAAELSAVWRMRRRAGIAVVAKRPTLSERRAALSEALIADFELRSQ
jgi:hypothetical protein